MSKNIIKKIIISENASLGEATRAMDNAGLRIVLVSSGKNKLEGVLSYGDVRRAYLAGIPFTKSIAGLFNPDPVIAVEGTSLKEIKKLSASKLKVAGGMIQVPVVNKIGEVVDLAIPNKRGGIDLVSKQKSLKLKNIEKILVTGGAGYLGSTLVRKLLKSGYKVKVLDKLLFGKESLDEIMGNENFELIVGNILNINDVIESAKDVDAVVHLAAIVGDEASSANPTMSIAENTIATITLAHVCKKFQINRFIFTSTCSVYGTSVNDELLTEEHPLFPVSLYAQSKIDSEIELKKLTDTNFTPTILRLATLFGWSFRPRFDLVVNLFTMLAHFKKEITVFGGGQWRPFISVSNAADAIVKVVESPIEKVGGQTFNVGSNENNYTIEKIAAMVARIVPNTTVKVESVNNDLRNYRVSFEKIKKTLDFQPKSALEKEVTRMLVGLKTNPIDYILKKAFNSPGLLKNFK